MTDKRALHLAYATLFARLVLGLTFLMSGIFKVFTLGPVGHVKQFFLPYQDTFLPTALLWVVGWTIPFVELICGGLVILGAFRSQAYAALGLLLSVVTFGHLLHDPFYSFYQHVLPRLSLLILLLLLPADGDRFSVDLFWRRRGTGSRAP